MKLKSPEQVLKELIDVSAKYMNDESLSQEERLKLQGSFETLKWMLE